MTRHTRKMIFYALLCAFFLLGIGVVFYAQGWRIDLMTGRIQKVGAIYVRSFPGDAHIFLNDAPVANQTWLLSRGTFIQNLFPKNYRLTLTAPGYLDWHENASVAPSLVATFNYAVLVPAAPGTVGTTTVTDFSAAAGETVTETATGAILLHGALIGRGTLVAASADLARIIFRRAADGAYILYDATAATSTNLSAALAENGVGAASIASVTIDPYNAATVIGRSAGEVWIFDAATDAITFTGRFADGTAAPALSPSSMAWISQVPDARTGTLALYNIVANTLATTSIPLAGIPREIQWTGNNDFGVLQSNGSLSVYHADTGQFQKLADDVKDFAATDDGSAIAALENRGLEVFPFTDTLTYHRFNIPNAAGADHVVWYKDMDHLFIIYPEHVSFLDIDDLSLQNFVTVAEGTQPLYKPQENVLYLINFSGKLAQFDFPS